MNSTARYWYDWKPDDVPRKLRNSAYSRRGQRGQHRPLLGEAALDVLDPGQALERRAQLVGGELPLHRAQLVQHQLEPQLGGLVLQDEQQLVVVLGHADRVLRGQDLVQVQVLAVREIDLEVPDDAVLQRTVMAGRH